MDKETDLLRLLDEVTDAHVHGEEDGPVAVAQAVQRADRVGCVVHERETNRHAN